MYVELFVHYSFVLSFQLYVNELIAYNPKACWWAHERFYCICIKFLYWNNILFKPNRPPVAVQNLTEKADIYWGNDQTWWSGYAPPDIPVCGFSNEKCPTGEIFMISGLQV